MDWGGRESFLGTLTFLISTQSDKMLYQVTALGTMQEGSVPGQHSRRIPWGTSVVRGKGTAGVIGVTRKLP